MNLRNVLIVNIASLAVALCVAPIHAQSVSDDPVLKSWTKQTAVTACGECHYGGSTGANNPFAKSSDFCRLDEMKFWLNYDKHAIARRRVEPLSSTEVRAQIEFIVNKLNADATQWLGESNILSKRICDKLGYEVNTRDGYAKFRDNCLTCHGGYRGDVNSEEKLGFDMPNQLDPLISQPGISCNFCHQEGDKDSWIEQHASKRAGNDWRVKAPEEKSAAGMRDLVNTVNQASLCLDCHIGNRDNNQFVTHEMYAAGHPPLPSVEVHTFCDQMPNHWRTLSELHDSLAQSDTRDKYFAVNFPQLLGGSSKIDAGKMFWNTREMLLGAIAARIKVTDLLIDSATEERWGDYALYDCAACHHELREPSARQLRGYAGAPGRPRQHEWPEPLLNAALWLSGLQQSAVGYEQQLAQEFSIQPFGKADNVTSLASGLKRSLEAALRAAEKQPIDARKAVTILKLLAETPSEQLLTYDAARQLAWGIQTIAAELKSEGTNIPAAIQTAIDSLLDPNATGIETQLPSGRDVFVYPKNLEVDLVRRAEYDLSAFVLRLGSLRSLLGS